MAVPKRKHSKARRDKRRNNVWKLDAPALMKCPQCGEYKRPHRLCGNCGYYNGRQVVKPKAERGPKGRGGAILLYFYVRISL